MDSILQTEKRCYVCDTEQNLHLHHIYGGSNRKVSDKNGFVVYLCAKHHNMSDEGVHFSKELDNFLKRRCQEEYEKGHTRGQFVALIGRNYLLE